MTGISTFSSKIACWTVFSCNKNIQCIKISFLKRGVNCTNADQFMQIRVCVDSLQFSKTGMAIYFQKIKGHDEGILLLCVARARARARARERERERERVAGVHKW